MRDSLETIVSNKLSEKRWKHSQGVAETGAKLAAYWGADRDKAWTAGILHDYARGLSHDELIRIAVDNGYQLIREEREHPIVLHAPVGAMLIKQELGINDEEVLSAVAKHTVGGEEMTLLDKIIFLADMIEPGRNWPGVEKLRELVYDDINQGMLQALEGSIKYVQERHYTLHPMALKAREAIMREITANQA